MIEIYNDNYINSPRFFNNILEDQKLITTILKNLNEIYKAVMSDYEYNYRQNILVKVKNGLDFATTLVYTKLNKFDQNTNMIKEIEKLVQSINATDGQLVALKNDSIEQIYENYEILSLNKFDFHRYNENFYDLRSYGNLILDLKIPLFNPKFDNSNIENCFQASTLPGFYQNRKY